MTHNTPPEVTLPFAAYRPELGFPARPVLLRIGAERRSHCRITAAEARRLAADLIAAADAADRNVYLPVALKEGE